MMSAYAAALLLAAAFLTDVRKRKIPNALCLSGMAAGLLLNSAAEGLGGLLFALWGLACGLLPMLLLYAIRAVGAGDVKLFAALGALAGGWFTLQTLTASLVCAGGIGLLILLWRSDRVQRLRSVGMTLFQLLILRQFTLPELQAGSGGAIRFPFMWAVLPGVVSVLQLREYTAWI